MGWPQIVIVVWFAMEIGISLQRHGERKVGNYSFPWQAFNYGLIFWLLYKGGFFS